MAVYAMEGRFGSGKTAFAVWFARRLAWMRGGVPVWANFHLAGMADVPGLDEVRPEKSGIAWIADLHYCERGVIVLDELQTTIHARRSNHNLEFMGWFDQCRKQDSDVICITQALHKIDVIVREMIDIAFLCEDRGEQETGEVISRVTPFDMYTGRAKVPFLFDRRESFAYYDHRERAWALLGKDDKKPKKTTAKQEKETADEVGGQVAIPFRSVASEKGRFPWKSA